MYRMQWIECNGQNAMDRMQWIKCNGQNAMHRIQQYRILMKGERLICLWDTQYFASVTGSQCMKGIIDLTCLDLLKLTSTHLESLCLVQTSFTHIFLSSPRKDNIDIIHLDSLGLTWDHLDLLGLAWTALIFFVPQFPRESKYNSL